MHLLQEATAIPFHRPRTDAQLVRDFLGTLARREKSGHLSFPYREPPAALLDGALLLAQSALAAVGSEGLPDARQQRLRTGGLLEEVDRPPTQRLHRHRHRTVCREDD